MSKIKSGRVKWFSSQLGYGHIAIDGDEDVFLHVSVLRSAGMLSVTSDSPITVEAELCDKGWRATKIIDLQPLPPVPSTKQVVVRNVTTEHEQATLKWFNAERGYGFLTQESRPDIFIHAETLRRCRVNKESLEPGQVILVKHGQTKNGRMATEIVCC